MFIFNEIFLTIEWMYNYNGAESYSHTDGKKKIFFNITTFAYFDNTNMSHIIRFHKISKKYFSKFVCYGFL